MSDPAIEAAQRAWDYPFPGTAGEQIALSAAREALQPIRARHYPVELAHTLTGQHKTVCAHCHRRGLFTTERERGDWPCPDALDAYTSEELA